jgi:hypothetical protein
MVLMAGPSFGQGQSLDQLIKNGVVVPSDKGQNQPKQPVPSPAPPAAPAKAPAPAPAPAAGGNAGFHMNLLPGWRAQLLQNGAVVARSGDGLSTVLVAPVLDAGNAAPLDWMRRSGAAFLGGYLKSPAIAAVYPSRSSRGAALASVEYAGANGPGTAHAMCFFAGGVGTMFVIAAPRNAFPNQIGPMIQMLASFSFTGEKAAGPGDHPGAGAEHAASSVQYTRFADPNEGAFTLDVPAGWKAEGGMKRHSTLDVRPAVYAASPDGGTVIRLGDWDLGTFTEPNQALAMAGMREGGTYSPGYGNVWQIRRYMPGPQFAQEYVAKLARDTQAGNVQIKTVKPLPEYSKQQNIGAAVIRTMAGEADFNCLRNGRESAGVVVAATTATSMSSSGGMGAIWYASFLAAFVAPADQAPAAEQIARHMTETFQMSVQWQAQQSQTTMRTSQIVRETGEATNKIIMDTYENRQRTLDRTNRNFDDYIRGVVRLRNPDTGDELEGEAGKKYYYKVPNRDRPVGTNRPIEGDPNVTELEQIR